MAKLKVWGMATFLDGVSNQPSPNGPERQVRAIVAAPSREKAARAIGVAQSQLANYGSVTGNAEEVATATAEPLTVFWRPLDDYSGPWYRYP
jgi:hypothetical protein